MRILLLIFTLIASTSSAGTPVLSFSTQDKEGIRWLILEATALDNIYGADLILDYDAAALEVVDLDSGKSGIQIQSGNLFGTSAFEVSNSVDTRKHSIRLALSLLNPAPAVSGSGILATIAFKNTKPGIVQVKQLEFGTKEGRLISAELPQPVLVEPARSAATTSGKVSTPALAIPDYSASGRDNNLMYILGGVFAFLLLINIVFFMYWRQKVKRPAI